MPEENEFPLPPASFPVLIESMLMQAQVHLGLLKFGQDEAEEPNLVLARHTIDMLGVLQDKTRGNLTVEEQRLLENGLTELRFRFVQVADAQKQKSQPAEEKQEGPRIITSDGGKGTKTE